MHATGSSWISGRATVVLDVGDELPLADWTKDDRIDLLPDFAGGETSDVTLGDLAEEGGFGWPCSANNQCTSFFCVPFQDGHICTVECEDECPEGWECKAAPIRSQDLVFICQPEGAGLCLEGMDGTTRPCFVTNGLGTCYGQETCKGAQGWVDCTAKTPESESCDNVDNNCDGTIDEGFAIQDWDGATRTRGESCGVGLCAGGTVVCNGSADAMCSSSVLVAQEVCNGLDDDCDNSVDEEVQQAFYVDQDQDGYGSDAATAMGCTPPLGFVANKDDCDDTSKEISPASPELCNLVDDDCSGVPDDAVVDCAGPTCAAAEGGYAQTGGELCEAGICAPTPGTPCGLYTCSMGGANGEGCALSCDSDFFCVPAAHCDLGSGSCVADLVDGTPCVANGECASGNCVDGVCCNSACSGLCMSCTVWGHAGECLAIPSGLDPDGECNGFPCTGFYAGWTLDQCFAASSVSDSSAACDGAGACLSAATLCPYREKAELAVECHPTCQEPAAGTCAGPVAGVCNNVPGGVLTCGKGECFRQVDGCVNGQPNNCIPGQAVAETCDNRDEDCDGTADNNLAGLDAGQPAQCTEATFVTDITEGQSEALIAVGTIYPSGDVDFWRFKAFESRDHILHGHGFKTTFRLEMPQGQDCVDYDLFVYGDGGCDLLVQGTVSGCTSEEVEYSWGGSAVSWDDKGFRVKIKAKNDTQWECQQYRLYAKMREN